MRDHLGTAFTLLTFADPPVTPATLHPRPRVIVVAGADCSLPNVTCLIDHTGLVKQRYGAKSGDAILIRPDVHIAARFTADDPIALERALERATGRVASAARKAA